jgi:type II secretory pathway component PulJ
LTQLRRHSDAEAGFTVIEMTVATAILLVVIGMFLNTLVSLTRSEDRAHRLVANEQNVRFELDQLSREIRAANPLVDLLTTNPSDYSQTIEFALGPSGASQQIVRWTYDTDPHSPHYEQLSRQLMAAAPPNNTVVSTSWYLIRVRNVETGVPVFTYYNSDGTDMVASGFSSHDIQYCSIRVHITLTSDSNPGPLPFTETQDVELRNRLPGNAGCV